MLHPYPVQDLIFLDTCKCFMLGTCTGTIQVRPRGETMGKEIDSISHGLGCPIPIIIKKGKRRPEAPMQAAKLASESGTIMRKNIKIYPNWTKYYKNNGEQLENLKGKLKVIRLCSTN